MLDPDAIQIQRVQLPSNIHLSSIEPFEGDAYDLEDEKDFKKYILDIERLVRNSSEYRRFIKFCREDLGMNKCAFLKNVSNVETPKIKVEIHHYPFTLADIVDIVYTKRVYYQESLSPRMVAKEVAELHAKGIVGLIPLSETVHELYHNGRLFIPIDKVFGRYKLFMQLYDPFISVEQRDIVYRIEKYTEEQNDMNDTTIIDQNKVVYQIEEKQYILPEPKHISDHMIEQMNTIKNNGYLLPSFDEIQESNKTIRFDTGRQGGICVIKHV